MDSTNPPLRSSWYRKNLGVLGLMLSIHPHLWSGSWWGECPNCPRALCTSLSTLKKVCMNLVLQGDPLWCQCIDCCLVSGLMCATHISSTVMIQSRNLSPSPWYHCRNVNADSMHFALCSGVSCFGTHLSHNFLNNMCSVAILCNKKQEMTAEFHNCEAKILHNAFLNKLHKIVHNDGWRPTMLLIMNILFTCTICLVMMLGP